LVFVSSCFFCLLCLFFFIVFIMCYAVFGRVDGLDGDGALVDFGGVRKRVCVRFLPSVGVGDFVLVHAGFAIEKVSESQALENRRLFSELGGGV
jgi:hydrogenase expression/formation protein HypC